MPLREDYKPKARIVEDYIVASTDTGNYVRVLPGPNWIWIGADKRYEDRIKEGKIIGVGAFLSIEDARILVEVLQYAILKYEMWDTEKGSF